jgi:repressor LexA
MSGSLTAAQRRVLLFLKEYAAANGFPPTAAEIAARFGIAEKNGFYYLSLLERKGFIRRKPHHPRFIEFVEGAAPRAPRRVPVLGRVPAGNPSEAIELAEDELFLDPALVGEGEVFSLRVKGDSMTGAGIVEGDYVLVRVQPDAADGDIVVALVDGEATVKRFRRRRGGFLLEAANPAYAPIAGDGASLRIAGKVVGLFRKL